jgi:hypothetical protein
VTNENCSWVKYGDVNSIRGGLKQIGGILIEKAIGEIPNQAMFG